MARYLPQSGTALLVEDVPLGPADAPFTLYGGTPFQWLLNAALVVLVAAMVTAWWRERTEGATVR